MDEHQGAVDSAQARAVNLIAQITAENALGPGAQIVGSGVLVYVLTWFMRTITPRLHSMERALFLNTQATLLMGIAQDEASASVKAKLASCLKDLERAEALRTEKEDKGE